MTTNYSNHWYFAHSKLIYDSPEEQKLLKFLEMTLHNVVCPNRDMGELGNIKPYLDRVEQCVGVIVAEYEGTLGKGAHDEVRHALKLMKPVLCLRLTETRRLVFRLVLATELLDESSWKTGYARLVFYEPAYSKT